MCRHIVFAGPNLPKDLQACFSQLADRAPKNQGLTIHFSKEFILGIKDDALNQSNRMGMGQVTAMMDSGEIRVTIDVCHL